MYTTSVIGTTLLALASLARAATVTYNWDITWVNAAPDGVSRPVVGINGQWPCPTIEATVGDTIVVNMNNKLGNETTGIHFHGINMIDTPWMDGPAMVTQCPVKPGCSLTYKFLADAPGTYWYHSHSPAQYPDGFRGPLIVHDPSDPYKGKYDEEIILTVSDWYHEETLGLVRTLLNPANTQFLPPFPEGLLVNEGGNIKFDFQKGKTYRFRIISFAAFASAMLHFDSHTMTVIAQDGSYISAHDAYQLRIAPAQRYDVLISAIDRDNRNYPFLVSLDMNRDFANDPELVWPFNATGYLVMDESKPFGTDEVDVWQPVDDSHFQPLSGYGESDILPAPTHTVVLDFDFCLDKNGIPRACFNGAPYVGAKVPTLYSAASLGGANTDPVVYGAVHPYVFAQGDVVQVVLNNLDPAIHPFHLHGHQFQVLDRPRSGAGSWSGRDVNYPSNPPSRDTVSVNAKSYVVLRHRVDHPGVFLFHCHIEWHVEMGLTVTFIEAPEKLRNASIPQDHLDACKELGILTTGNAAGNTADPTDTTGFLTDPDPTYNGTLFIPPAQRFRSRKIRRSM